jgi:hypothetical protein
MHDLDLCLRGAADAVLDQTAPHPGLGYSPSSSLAGQYGGQQVVISLVSARGGRSSIHLGVPLGERALSLHITPASGTVSGPPQVRTGAPGFDAAFHVYGYPAVVVGDAIDDETRGLLATAFPAGSGVDLGTESGFLVLTLTPRESGLMTEDSRATAAALRRWIDLLVGLAARLQRAYDEHRAAIAAAQGPAAADRWVAEQVALRDRLRARRRRIARLVVGLLAGAVLLSLLGTAVWAVWMIFIGRRHKT